MIENEHTFQNKDGLQLFYHQWLPDSNDIHAVVMIVHGHGEHSGRYRHVAESFTQVGFACYGVDHRGHGKSGGARVYFNDITHVVDDLRQLVDTVQAKYPGKDLLMFGHSMGSLISLEFVLRYPNEVRALALTGTAITGEELQPKWLISLASQAAKFMPKVRLSPPLSVNVLTTDPEQIKLWEADPMTEKGMWRIGTSVAMLKSGRYIREHAHQLTLPLLILHGGDDVLTPSSGATYLEEHAKSDDMTVKIYPGLRHELVNEIGRDEIITEIRDWLMAHS